MHGRARLRETARARNCSLVPPRIDDQPDFRAIDLAPRVVTRCFAATGHGLLVIPGSRLRETTTCVAFRRDGNAAHRDVEFPGGAHPSSRCLPGGGHELAHAVPVPAPGAWPARCPRPGRCRSRVESGVRRVVAGGADAQHAARAHLLPRGACRHGRRQQRTSASRLSREKIGGAEGDRTLDLRIANATLSQLSYRPTAGAVMSIGKHRPGRNGNRLCSLTRRAGPRRCCRRRRRWRRALGLDGLAAPRRPARLRHPPRRCPWRTTPCRSASAHRRSRWP